MENWRDFGEIGHNVVDWIKLAEDSEESRSHELVGCTNGEGISWLAEWLAAPH